jgi:hypothetical protein
VFCVAFGSARGEANVKFDTASDDQTLIGETLAHRLDQMT